MEYLSVILEVAEMIAILYCFSIYVGEEGNNRKAANILVISASMIFKYILFWQPITRYILRLVIFVIYIVLCFQKRRLHYFISMYIAYASLNLVKVLLAFVSYPVALWMKIEPLTIGEEILNIIFHIIGYLVVMFICTRKRMTMTKGTSIIAKTGMLLLLAFCDCILLVIRSGQYDSKKDMFYGVCLVVLAFCTIILVLWICDKIQEQKKLRELVAYTHRTREVIPSVSRVLGKLEDMYSHVDQTSEIIKELKLICNTDMDKTKRESASIKTFETTGSYVLDEQLRKYLEEAAEQGFCLDVMVRASMKEILAEDEIDFYSLLQVIGDLYRNAYRAVLKSETPGRILICFGYNAEGYYEISIHDNGIPFPEYVLQHLGERGVTTGGTGHGMADVFEVLERNQISFVLNQDGDSNSMFTKSICIIFDGQTNKKIKNSMM